MIRENFEREVIDRLARIEQMQTDLTPRCDSHSADIKAVDVRITSLEDTRTFVKGMMELAAKTGLAAIGISGIIYGWIEAFGSHADKVVK